VYMAVALMTVPTSWLLLRLLVMAVELLPTDVPNQRSLHDRAIPKAGGVVIVLVALVGVGLVLGFDHPSVRPLVSGALLLAVVSLWDDYGHVSPLLRLLIQGSASLILVSAIYSVSPPWLNAALVVLAVWAINLYNFMDGMDGLAASMAIVGFSALGMLGFLGDDLGYACAAWSVAGAAAGFLVFNFPPARIFMGDVGSTFLGYMMAAASLWGVQHQIFPFWAPLLIFAPFWLDATITLLRRLLRGERVWEAHRSHFYQRAVLAGVPVRRVLLVETLLMLGCSAVAIAVVPITRG